MYTIKEDLEANLGKFECDPCIKHHFSDNVYAKEMKIAKGFRALSHAHNYSHLSFLVKGSAIVRTDDHQEIYHAPACIEIKAKVNHEVYALEDVVWFCVHATEEKDVEKIDEVLICQN